MKSEILVKCVCLVLVASLCFISSCASVEPNKSLESVQSEESSEDSRRLPARAILEHVFGKFESDVQFEKQDIVSFMESIDGWCPYVDPIQVRDEEIIWITCWAGGDKRTDDDYMEVFIFDSCDTAKKWYIEVFKFSPDFPASKIKYYKLSSVVQIGNIIAVGGPSLIVPLLQKYQSDFVPTTKYALANTIDEYKNEINIEKISLYMSALGYTCFKNRCLYGEVYASWYGFMNFETNDFCYIIQHEEAVGKKRAEAYFKILPSNYGYSYLYTEDCIFVSATDVWKNILSQIESGKETGDGLKQLKK